MRKSDVVFIDGRSLGDSPLTFRLSSPCTFSSKIYGLAQTSFPDHSTHTHTHTHTHKHTHTHTHTHEAETRDKHLDDFLPSCRRSRLVYNSQQRHVRVTNNKHFLQQHRQHSLLQELKDACEMHCEDEACSHDVCAYCEHKESASAKGF